MCTKMTTPILIGSATPSIAVSSKLLELQIFRDAENVQNDHVKGIKLNKNHLVP